MKGRKSFEDEGGVQRRPTTKTNIGDRGKVMFRSIMDQGDRSLKDATTIRIYNDVFK